MITPREMCIRDRRSADEDNATTSHELLDTLRLRAGVIVAVAFHEVDYTPHCQARAEGDNEKMCIRDRLLTSTFVL